MALAESITKDAGIKCQHSPGLIFVSLIVRY